MSVPARPLRADAARNRARVLETAYETFAAEGLAVPIDEIARRAGVGAGTVYRHFPTKEDLFSAVVDSRIRRIIGEGRGLLDVPGPGEALFAFLRSMVLDWGATDQGLVDALAGLGIDVDTVAPDAIPPLNTISVALAPAPLPISTSPIVLPPDTSTVPPPCTLLLVAVPPDRTISVPPDRTMMPLLVCPPEMVRVWPLLTTPLLAPLPLPPPTTNTWPPVAEIVPLAVLGGKLVMEFVVDAFGGEITLLLGDPFVQPHMRRDDEFGHLFLLSRD